MEPIYPKWLEQYKTKACELFLESLNELEPSDLEDIFCDLDAQKYFNEWCLHNVSEIVKETTECNAYQKEPRL